MILPFLNQHTSLIGEILKKNGRRCRQKFRHSRQEQNRHWLHSLLYERLSASHKRRLFHFTVCMAYLSQWMHLPNLDLVGEVHVVNLTGKRNRNLIYIWATSGVAICIVVFFILIRRKKLN